MTNSVKGIRYLYRTENKRGGMRMQIKIISCETLKEYMQRDDCILLDLREKADYEQGHLPRSGVCRLGNLWSKI